MIAFSDLRDADLNEEIKSKANLWVRGKDKDNYPIITFRVKNHVKTKHLVEDGKKFFMYHLERIER
jgi:hypothetical protein